MARPTRTDDLSADATERPSMRPRDRASTTIRPGATGRISSSLARTLIAALAVTALASSPAAAGATPGTSSESAPTDDAVVIREPGDAGDALPDDLDTVLIEPRPGSAPSEDTVVTTPTPVAERCSTPILIIGPDLVEGDPSTVSLTSQALDRDLPGWLHVSWQAAAGTTLTGVTVQSSTGFHTLVGDVASGTVEDVLELTFCGRVAPREPAPTPVATSPATAPVRTTPDRAGATTGSGTTGSAAGSTNGARDPEPSTDDAAGTGDVDDVASLSSPEDDGAEGTVDDAPLERAVASTEADEPESTEVEPAIQDDDTEVLGVQFSRSADDDGTSGGLVALLLTGVVATAAGALAWLRRRAVTTRDTGGIEA